jgi:hypothetical protein
MFDSELPAEVDGELAVGALRCGDFLDTGRCWAS